MDEHIPEVIDWHGGTRAVLLAWSGVGLLRLPVPGEDDEDAFTNGFAGHEWRDALEEIEARGWRVMRTDDGRIVMDLLPDGSAEFVSLWRPGAVPLSDEEIDGALGRCVAALIDG